jgi:hypothetical protein
MVKFVAGPLFGTAHQLTVLETAVFTILGMMTTVLIILLIGGKTREWFLQKTGLDKKISRGNVRFRHIWERYGVPGIAFITPLILTPIGGAVLAVMMGGSRKKIVKYMFVSAIFWGFAISFIFDRVGTAIFGF